MDSIDAQALDDEPMCVGRATDITGHDVAAWVIVSINRRGQPRYRPQLERYFVRWGIEWRGRRRRSFDEAKAVALKVLHRVDHRGERRERPW